MSRTRRIAKIGAKCIEVSEGVRDRREEYMKEGKKKGKKRALQGRAVTKNARVGNFENVIENKRPRPEC